MRSPRTRPTDETILAPAERSCSSRAASNQEPDCGPTDRTGASRDRAHGGIGEERRRATCGRSKRRSDVACLSGRSEQRSKTTAVAPFESIVVKSLVPANRFPTA
ncbi:MAG TPA: hypothetical protein DCQ98_14685 [Planctomycetaceae bacterium]|nr:hypothetical protein [Planctomycetaceae bacterium]